MESQHMAPQVDRAAARLGEIQRAVGQVVVGQERLVESLLVALLCRGHVLLEGVPGLAKTLTVRTLAGVVGGSFQRLQFTPDMLPSDVTGHPDLRSEDRDLHPASGPGLRQPGARGRDQPRPGQGPVGPARVDGGAPGYDRGHDPRAPRSVRRAGDPEPDRAGGHLPAARGPARPLPVQGPGRLPRPPRRSAGCSSSTSGSVPEAVAHHLARGDPWPRRGRPRGLPG